MCTYVNVICKTHYILCVQCFPIQVMYIVYSQSDEDDPWIAYVTLAFSQIFTHTHYFEHSEISFMVFLVDRVRDELEAITQNLIMRLQNIFQIQIALTWVYNEQLNVGTITNSRHWFQRHHRPGNFLEPIHQNGSDIRLAIITWQRPEYHKIPTPEQYFHVM